MKKDSIRIIVLLAVIAISGGFVIGKLSNWGQVAQVVTSNAEIQLPLTVSGSPKTVSNGLYGLHLGSYFSKIKYFKNNPTQFNQQTGYTQDPGVTAAVSEIKAKVYRFPAGTDVRYYHLYKPGTTEYAKGYGYRLADIQNDIQVTGEHFVSNTYGDYPNYLAYEQTLPEGRNFLFDYIEMLKADNAKAMYVININYGTIQEALAVIALMKQNNVEIAGVELGNETYAENIGFHENPAEYLAVARTYASAIKAQYPDIKTGLVVARYRSAGTGSSIANDAWNTAIAQAMAADPALYDTYIYHAYLQIKCDNLPTRQAIFSCVNDRIGYASGYSSAQAVKSTVGVNLGWPTITESLDYYKTKFPGKKMWITEWSLSHITGVLEGSGYYSNSLANAMSNAAFRHVMNSWNAANNGVIQYAVEHNITGYTAYGLITTKVPGETINDIPNSQYVRRALYHEALISKRIYTRSLKLLDSTISTNEKVSIYTYLDQNTNFLFVYFANRSGKTLSIPTITYNGQQLNTTNSAGTIYMMSGADPSASIGKGGAGEYTYDGAQISIRQEPISSVASEVIPGYAYGYMSFPVASVPVNLPPTVSITTPTQENFTLTSSSLPAVQGTASDPEGEQMTLSWTNTVGGVIDSTGTKSIASGSWSAGAFTLKNGINVIKVSATDSKGLVATDEFSVTYNAPTVPDTKNPVVKIISPIGYPSPSYPVGAPIQVEATATDNVGVTKVEFFSGSAKICTDTTAPYTCTITATSFGGSNVSSFRAFAFDAKNNSDVKSFIYYIQ